MSWLGLWLRRGMCRGRIAWMCRSGLRSRLGSCRSSFRLSRFRFGLVWGRLARCRSPFRGPCAVVAHFAGARGCCGIGSSVIHRSLHRPVSACCLLMLRLLGRHRNVLLVRHGCFCLCWTGRSSSRPPVEACPAVRGTVVRHRCVVNVVHHYRVHVRYACVVVVLLSSPISTVEAGAGIAESIVNASIKPNGRSPVAHIPDVEAVHERPISGRPKQARFRGEDPSPGNPVVARVVVIGPIAWHLDVAGFGTDRLRIDG